MGGEPRPDHRAEVPGHALVVQRRGETERIAGDRCRPATRVVVRAGHPLARLHERADIVNKRFDALREVGRTGRPVVHLDVDVVVVVHAPRTVDVVVPYSLKVRREVASARRGDQQIAPELEVKLLQTGVGSP